MSAADELITVLKQTLDAIGKGHLREARRLLERPFDNALNQVDDEQLKDRATTLYGDLKAASVPNARWRISEALERGPNLKQQFESVQSKLNNPYEATLQTFTETSSGQPKNISDDVRGLLDKNIEQLAQKATDIGRIQALKESKSIDIAGALEEALGSDTWRSLGADNKKELTTLFEKAAGQVKQKSEQPFKQLDTINNNLHGILHTVSTEQKDGAVAFTKHEQGLFDKQGRVGYNLGLIGRRWGASDHISNGNSVKIDKPAPPAPAQSSATPSDSSPHDSNFGLLNRGGPSFQLIGQNGQNSGRGSNDAPPDNTPQTTVEEVTLNGKALDEFSQVNQLDTWWKQLAAGAMTSVGVGLVLHGGYNMVRAFKPPKEGLERIELKELGQSQKPDHGVNWTRLFVGAGEATVGAAVTYRGLAGRWNMFGGPLTGEGHPLIDCQHDHGHGI